MSTAIAAVLWVGVTLYAVLAGADFGVGVWDLTAGGPQRGARLRALVDRALAPVWEANHVWLIFCLVVLWTGFPKAFAALMTTLFVPLSLAALGIVLRGAGFAFRKVVRGVSRQRAFGATFAFSSVLTPFFMGTVVGAIATGRVPAGGSGDPLDSWVNAPSLVVGALFVATCAYLSAVFLVADASRTGQPDLAEAFRRRAVGAAALAGALAIAGLVVVSDDAPRLYDRLTGAALPLVVVSGVCGVAVLGLLAARRTRATRPLAVLAVAAVVWAWGIAQHPYLLPTTLTIDAGAGAHGSQVALLVVFGAALVIVVPALALLLTLHQRSLLD